MWGKLWPLPVHACQTVGNKSLNLPEQVALLPLYFGTVHVELPSLRFPALWALLNSCVWFQGPAEALHVLTKLRRYVGRASKAKLWGIEVVLFICSEFTCSMQLQVLYGTLPLTRCCSDCIPGRDTLQLQQQLLVNHFLQRDMCIRLSDTLLCEADVSQTWLWLQSVVYSLDGLLIPSISLQGL